MKSARQKKFSTTILWKFFAEVVLLRQILNVFGFAETLKKFEFRKSEASAKLKHDSPSLNGFRVELRRNQSFEVQT